MVSIRRIVLATALAASSLPAHATSVDNLPVVPNFAETPVAEDGLPCEAAAVRSFPSVWLGHFSGGFSHYTGPGGVIITDWRDEKLCFPTRASCRRFIGSMRRDYHQPEGYTTCLPIR